MDVLKLGMKSVTLNKASEGPSQRAAALDRDFSRKRGFVEHPNDWLKESRRIATLEEEIAFTSRGRMGVTFFYERHRLSSKDVPVEQ